ncbi:hypothetical protein BRM39_00665, partial [Xanthomonas oryzae pv. oryzae]
MKIAYFLPRFTLPNADLLPIIVKGMPLLKEMRHVRPCPARPAARPCRPPPDRRPGRRDHR